MPRWEIDWIIKWQAQKVCFPVIFQRPDLRDVLEQLQPVPRPVPQPDPGPIRLDPRQRFDPDLLRRGIDLGAFAGPATCQIDLRTSAPFSRDVLMRLAKVPYGEVTTYSALARAA